MLKQASKVPSFVLLLFIAVCFMSAVLDYNFGLRKLTLKNNNNSLPFDRNKSVPGKLMNIHNNDTGNMINDKMRKFYNVSPNSRFRSGQNALIPYRATKARNPVFEINEELKRILKTGSASKTQNMCNLTNTKHFLAIPPPVGRLGNLMFQLASALGIATKIQYRLVIPPNHPILMFFHVQKYVSYNAPDNLVYYDEDPWITMTQRNNMEWMCHNFSLRAALQNFKYFSHIQGIVRKLFVFKSDVMKTAKTFLVSKIPNHATKIGIHVRRGDFLDYQWMRQGRVVANKSYINKAMSYFRRRFRHAHFVVCSDDMQWCRKNIRSSDVTFSEFKEPIIDMAILSLCDHVIITVGTFSWWAGFLSGGTVVYLNDYPVPGSELEKFAPRDIYYPPEWIGMSNAYN